MRISIFFFLCLIHLACVHRSAKTSVVIHVKNFYKVDDSLFRSAQPSRLEMKTLSDSGIKTVLNLRLLWNDEREAKNTNLVLLHQPINTNKISYDDIVVAMKAIHSAPKPILIHCLHGSDRTGCIVAAYRIVFSGWTKEEAIKEFLNERFGYHEKYFPNILMLLQTLDVEQLKKDILL